MTLPCRCAASDGGRGCDKITSSGIGGCPVFLFSFLKWHSLVSFSGSQLIRPIPTRACPGGSAVKNPFVIQETPCHTGDTGSILGSGRSSGEGNGNPLQYSCLEYSCLENSMDRWAWWATVYRVAKSRTWLSDWMTTTDLWKCIDPCAPTFPCNFKVCGLAPVYLWTLGQSVENFLALYMQRDLMICIRVIMQKPS